MNTVLKQVKDSDDVPCVGAALLKRNMSVSEGIVIALQDAGIDLVMGICSGHTTPIFDALFSNPSIRTIQVKQELVAALAANGYGRLAGKPAVIMGEGEFILGTGTQGIIESRLGSTPMVIITEMFDGGRMSHHGAYHSGSGDHTTYDAVAAYRALCKTVFVAHYPAQAVQLVQLAVKHSMAGNPGAVAVILRSACFESDVGPKSFPRLYSSAGYIHSAHKGVDQGSIARAVSRFASAKRPVIIAGHGVRLSKAYDQLMALAIALDAPIVTTQGGKGVVDEYSPYAAGVFGEWGKESANALVAGADLLLAVGTRLGPLDTVDQTPALIDPTRQVLVQIDAEALNAGWTLPIDTVVVGDAAAAMSALKAAYSPAGTTRPEKAVDRVATAIRDYDMPLTRWHMSDESPLRPERAVSIIRDVWPANGIVTTDAGESRPFMLNWFKSHGGGAYLVPHGGGGMGYAIGSAFGAKLLHPDRPVLAVCGDGGFAMVMNTLMNAIQEKVPFGVVVFNNHALGWCKHTIAESKQHHYLIHDFDYAAIARSMGCAGARVDTPDALRAALEDAATSQVPYVIDAQMSKEATFVDATAKIALTQRERPVHAKSE